MQASVGWRAFVAIKVAVNSFVAWSACACKSIDEVSARRIVVTRVVQLALVRFNAGSSGVVGGVSRWTRAFIFTGRHVSACGDWVAVVRLLVVTWHVLFLAMFAQPPADTETVIHANTIYALPSILAR